MTTIRVIFDGKTFVPQQQVSLPAKSEGLVLMEGTDLVVQQQLDRDVRAYYQQDGADADDEAWGKATAPDSQRAWEDTNKRGS